VFSNKTFEKDLNANLITCSHELRDRNSAEQVIEFVPANIFANKILKTFRGTIQSCLSVYEIIFRVCGRMYRGGYPNLCMNPRLESAAFESL
jgi:hypothetical protein